MALSEPVWRVKRTPCPFYAKGHCVFAERCNFIHPTDEDERTLVEPEPEPESDTKPHVLATPPKKAKRTWGTAPGAPTTRMSELLRELKSVIGEVDSTELQGPSQPSGSPLDSRRSSPAPEPFLPLPTTSVSDADAPDEGYDAQQPPMPFLRDSYVRPEFTSYAESAHLLSPVTIPDLQLRSFVRDYNDDDAASDASFATWATPHPMTLSPPRSPALTSTFDLLSSPFGSPSSRLVSPHLAAFMNRIHPLSPSQRDFSRDADDFEPPDLSLDELDSPNNYFQAEHTVQLGTSDLDPETRSPSPEEDAGPTSRWDSLGQDTAVFLGGSTNDDVDIAMSRGRPTDLLNFPPDGFDPSEALTSSPTASERFRDHEEDVFDEEEDDDDGFSDESPTAQLAYLGEGPDDTLNSLYDVYSDLDSPEMAARSDLDSSDSSSPAEEYTEPPPIMTPHTTFRRSAVFTPPPLPNSSARNSLDSVGASPDSPSRYRVWSSPFSRQKSPQDLKAIESPRSASSSARSQTSQDALSSTKVPFGFRKSIVMGGSRNSSLILNRASKTPDEEAPAEIKMDTAPASPTSSMASKAASRGLKPLRLSIMLTNDSFTSPSLSRSSLSSHLSRGNSASTHVPSQSTSSNNALLSSLPYIPEEHSNQPPHTATPDFANTNRASRRLSYFKGPTSAPLEPPTAWTRLSHRTSSQPVLESQILDDVNDDYTIRRPIPVEASSVKSRGLDVEPPRPLSALVTTPKPALMFAIASDDPEQVRQVLASGEAGPNDSVGPQSALAFTLTNDALTQKLDIVKVLLEYGADIGQLQSELGASSGEMQSILAEVDDATKYYLSQAETSLTRKADVLMKRSSFKPLARIRYGIVGQDRALEQLFRILSMHNQKITVTPIVMLLCGPSGHGKSLLAQKFGSLLDVPAHTVNMTTLRSAHDLWQSYSISPDQNHSQAPGTLIEFLINNEGKRCVVVLDEIEKTMDDSVLWSLLLPWEVGRCSFEANSMNIDVRNVVWLGTSNIGHDLIYDYHASLKHGDDIESMSRPEYVELMARLRPRVSERLGASILSRVTTILPFVPFTVEERRVIANEALQSISTDITGTLSKVTLNEVIEGALGEFIPSEGARSLYRAVSSLLVDAIDLA